MKTYCYFLRVFDIVSFPTKQVIQVHDLKMHTSSVRFRQGFKDRITLHTKE